MIEAKELWRFRKALNRLMKRPYSHDDAVHEIARLFLKPEDKPEGMDPCRYGAADGQGEALKAKYAAGVDTTVETLCVGLMTSLVNRADEQDGELPAPVSVALARLAAMCYGEHAVETQRKWIKRKGYKLSDDGARSLYSRERHCCRERYGEPENLWASKAVADVAEASAGSMPYPPSDDTWGMAF
ncbi:hypothetical protein H6A14_08595 [Bifidobacterium pullorum subsp. saeculare]|uniref:hypothetical protein n=1 Tax=Bifidobacterium pullorum TaxID=78448 RepID=UPI00195C2582|nr:hypothetical protein [Bifidobacterium pullorum]MBM6731215.1 hypothetical protein [Bifidobacterium pullorum subsp. saeculare]